MKHALVKDHIIQTASHLFYQNGYNLTGINEIIKEAGIAKATLYNHFKSKEDICIAYLQYKNASFITEIKAFVAVFFRCYNIEITISIKILQEEIIVFDAFAGVVIMIRYNLDMEALVTFCILQIHQCENTVTITTGWHDQVDFIIHIDIRAYDAFDVIVILLQ